MGGCCLSRLVNRQFLGFLRNLAYPSLPQDVQNLFPRYQDPIDGDVPNILEGHLSELGANANFPLITVSSSGALEGLTRGTYRHLQVFVDYWVSAAQTQNLDGRNVVSQLYEYASKVLQDGNMSGGGVAIKRCYETENSDVLFQAAEKLYHIATVYRVEAIAASWY